MSQIVVSPAFAVPFAVRQMEHPESLNTELRELFLAREAEGDAHKEKADVPTLKVKTFESTFRLFSWPEECVQQLKRFCFETLTQVLVQFNNYDKKDVEQLEIFNDTWFHVTRTGGYMGAHNHPNASWSGVYCVDNGGDDEENPDSGVLRFIDPRNSTIMYIDAGNFRPQEPFGTGTRNYKLKPGQLVVFPSYLLHEVAPFTGEGTRITVAFNTWAKYGGRTV